MDFKARLTAIAKQSGIPANTGQRDWDAVHFQLGHTLPVDFRWMIESFGSFELFDYFGIYDPFRNQLTRYHTLHSDLLNIRRKYNPELPDPERFLSFGSDENSDFALWEIRGEPEAWKVAYVCAALPEVRRYDMNALEFIVGLCEGTIDFPFWEGESIRKRPGPKLKRTS
jgi:hypothetical protein